MTSMRREALAVLELPEIHEGLRVVDAMVKEAVVEILGATPVPPGRFLIIVSGGVAEVESAWGKGLGIAGTTRDQLFLAEFAPEILQATEALRSRTTVGSPPGVSSASETPPTPFAPGGGMWATPADCLGVFQTRSVSSGIDAADRLIKGTRTRLHHLHLARGIAGQSFGVLSGTEDMVEAALEMARERGEHHAQWVGSSMVRNVDPAVAARLADTPWGFFGGQELL